MVDGLMAVLRRPTPVEYPANWVLKADPRVTVGKGNTLNGQYVQSVVWTICFRHKDGSVSDMAVCCNLRDVRRMAESGEIEKLVREYDR